MYSGDAAERNDVMIDIDDIQGAVARGWCHKVNEHKVMDPDLANAIVEEITVLINTASDAAEDNYDKQNNDANN